MNQADYEKLLRQTPVTTDNLCALVALLTDHADPEFAGCAQALIARILASHLISEDIVIIAEACPCAGVRHQLLKDAAEAGRLMSQESRLRALYLIDPFDACGGAAAMKAVRDAA